MSESELVYNGEKVTEMKIFRVRSALRDFQIEFGRYDTHETLVKLLSNHLLAIKEPIETHHYDEVEVAVNSSHEQNGIKEDEAINIACSTDAAVTLEPNRKKHSTGSDRSDSLSRQTRAQSVVYSLRSRKVDNFGESQTHSRNTSPVPQLRKSKRGGGRKRKETSETSPAKKAAVTAAEKKPRKRTKTRSKSTATQVDETLGEIDAEPCLIPIVESDGSQEVHQIAPSVSLNSIAHQSEEEQEEVEAQQPNSPEVTYDTIFNEPQSYDIVQQNLLRDNNIKFSVENSELHQGGTDRSFPSYPYGNISPRQNFSEQSQEDEQHQVVDEEIIENESGSHMYMDVEAQDQKDDAMEPSSPAQSFQATLNESEEANDPEVNDEEDYTENDHADPRGDAANDMDYESEDFEEGQQDEDAEGDDHEEDQEYDNNEESQAEENVIDLCDSDDEKEEANESNTNQPVVSDEQVVPAQITNVSDTQNHPSQSQSSQLTLTQPLPATVNTPVRHAIEAFQKLGTRFFSVVVGEQTGEKLTLQEYDLLKSLLEKNKPSDDISAATLSVDPGILVVQNNSTDLMEADTTTSAMNSSIQAPENIAESNPVKEFLSLPPLPESVVKPIIPRHAVEGRMWDSRDSFLPSPSPISTKTAVQAATTSAVTQKSSITTLADILNRRNSLREIFQPGDDGTSTARKRSFVEFHENDEDKFGDSVLFSASKKATIESFHSAQPAHRQLVSSLGSGILQESQNRKGSESAFPSRSSYIPVFKSNTARFTSNEASSRQSLAGPHSQSLSRAPLSLSYSERRKIQRQSEGRDGATTVSKKILETLSGINTPIENERSRSVAISWKDFGAPPSKKSDGESTQKSNLIIAQEPASQAKADYKPINLDISREAIKVPVEPKQKIQVFSKIEPPTLPKPVFTTATITAAAATEENPKKTVTFSAIDEEFIFEEPSDDLMAPSNSATPSSIGADGIKYIFSPPGNRRGMSKATSSVPPKENIILKDTTTVDATKPKEKSETPAINIWATVATDKVKCGACMVPNLKSATKCVSCESSLTAEVAATPKAKSIWDVNTNDFIKCSACMVQNSKTAVKCASCESPLTSSSASSSAAITFPPAFKSATTADATKLAPSTPFIFGIQPSAVPDAAASISTAASQPFASKPFASALLSSESGNKVSSGFVFGVQGSSTIEKAGNESSFSENKSTQPPPAATDSTTAPTKLAFEPPKSSVAFGSSGIITFGSVGSGTTTAFGVDASKPLSQIPQFGTTTPSVWNAPDEKSTAKQKEENAPFSQSLKSNLFSRQEEPKPPASTVGMSRPFSTDDDSGDRQDAKRKSTRQNESETSSSATSAVGNLDEKANKATFTFGGVGPTSITAGSASTGPFSSSTATPGPFSVSGFSSSSAFPSIPVPAAETKTKFLKFGTSTSTTTAPSTATNIEPKLIFGSAPAQLSTIGTSTVQPFGVSATTAGAPASSSVMTQPFGTGSSTSFGSQPSFGSASSSFSSITPATTTTAVSEPTFGSVTTGGMFNAPKTAAPAASSFHSTSLGASSTNAFASAFSSNATTAPSFAPSVSSIGAPSGSKPEGINGGSEVDWKPKLTKSDENSFGFRSNSTAAVGPFSVSQPASSFGFVGSESPSMDMAGEGSNLSAPVTNSNTSNNLPTFNFGAHASSAGIGSGSAFGMSGSGGMAAAANPFGAIIAQTPPASTSGIQPFAFGGASTGSTFGGSSGSNVFGSSFNSQSSQPQPQQPMPFGGSGAPSSAFGGMFAGAPSLAPPQSQQPAVGAFGGFGAGAATPSFGGGAAGGFSLGADPKKNTSSTNLAGRKILKAKRPAH